MRSSIFGSIISGFIAASLAACSGANVEPVDQSATAESARLATPAPAGSVADASGQADGEHHHHGPRHGAPDPARLIERFDANKDGKLELSELPPHMQKFMAKGDTNNDGVLSADELKAGAEKMRAEHLAKVDTDHDGKVSPEERKAAFEKFAEARFEKMDKNNDGALSKDEIGDKRWQRLSVADTDKNGSVTREELKTAFANGSLKFPHHPWRHHQPNGDAAPAPDSDSGAPTPPPSGT